ncbi:hypothetical protein KIN20_019375 [Parelaphostrongylus tenuis]|uniref:Uncharacterized protein n=1 Tax=Parelaphostrongylus tenuis TaxID=148309 RepID=A0AAD5QSW0_PARTN|nr:hypothetical protein KIN20_019375 [Parelaphostrongylus tenuis]
MVRFRARNSPASHWPKAPPNQKQPIASLQLRALGVRRIPRDAPCIRLHRASLEIQPHRAQDILNKLTAFHEFLGKAVSIELTAE